jgi:hypothetical protein
MLAFDVARVLFFMLNQSTSTIAVETLGEHHFGIETSVARACDRAKQVATEEALRKVSGESMMYIEQMHCTDDCAINRTQTSFVQGNVRSMSFSVPQVQPVFGHSVCRVTGKFEVEPPVVPAWQFVASLNRDIYRPGEAVRVTYESSEDVYVSLFNWADGRVSRIYPNQHELAELRVGAGSLPNRSLLVVSRPAGDGKVADEYVFVVATKRQIDWLWQYTIEEFHRALSEVQDKRVIKMQYQIIF